MNRERAGRPNDTPSLSGEERNEIHQHVADLEEDLRRVVVDYYFERRTLAELAGAARCSTGAVWKKLQKAHEALRRSLAGAGIATGMLAVFAFLESGEAVGAPTDLMSNPLLSKAAGIVGRGRTSAFVGWGGLSVRLKPAMLSVLVIVAGGSLLGYALHRRLDARLQAPGLAARPASPAKEAGIPAGSSTALPMETASPVREEPVPSFSSGLAFWSAFCRAAILRDESDRWTAFRRLGLRRSDEEFRDARAKTPWKRGSERWPEILLKNIFFAWMRQDSREAARFIGSLPSDRIPADAYLNWTAGAALHEWAGEDPDAALAFVQLLPQQCLMAEFAPGMGYLARWKADPEGFLRWFRALAPRALNWEVLQAAVPRLAAANPLESLEWVHRLPAGDYRRASERMIAEAWSQSSSWSQRCLDILRIQKDFHAAVSAVARDALSGVSAANPEWTTEMAEESERDIFRPLVMAVLVNQSGRDPILASRFVETLPSEAWAIALVDQVAQKWGQDHPRDAIAWLQQQAFPSLHVTTVNAILQTWTVSAGSDPREILEVVETLPEGFRLGARCGVLQHWAQCDPPAAARTCDALPSSSLAIPGLVGEALLRSVVASVGRSWSVEDPAAAIDWVRKRDPPG
ncbi:MAG TPA: hypothetical protein VG457_05380, partial [Planctomycetota bacterium]|nr:hypothetical protein [Planctomycetota bacterium]